eukprot:CAMPEP_0195521084 /NCGR_PEP_ID=MMETSP0794_2-20130614/17906_1 /TAXON_ID=515487 /ORGANISM="Stephanopyxis turris, Strain CCMP 815" /LENGTH=525 /DNA_ID=CAMNT_0040650553 /DNA_START=26 /DNA_END=1603 /DNA_ORIENTATION=-
MTYPVFSMGLKTYKVPMSLHAENRSKLINKLRSSSSSSSCSDGIVYLVGGTARERNDSDHEPIFRQESYFHYLFGVKEPGFAGSINVKTGETTLFQPRLPKEYAVIMGSIETCEEIQKRYGVDKVMYLDQAEDFLMCHCTSRTKENNDSDEDGDEKKSSHNGVVLLCQGTNSDSGNMYHPPKLNIPQIDTNLLFDILAECRVIKTPNELSLLRHVAELSSEAHVEMMRLCQIGMMEYQLESIFRHYVYYHYGCRNMGYTPICGCGPNSAVLHYGHAGAPNDRTIQEGDMCLLDLGTEYHCYGSDITCSFPANGTFTENQIGVYEGVLQAQKDVIEMLKPGVSWVDCHYAAECAILRALIALGVVVAHDKTVEELVVQMRLGAVFMPHGLGHFIGVDTHDVGGYLPNHPPRSPLPGLRSLRTSRIMKEGMVITVEPGCYFINALLDEALDVNSPLAKYLVTDRLDQFRNSGGVRLEDVVAVTKDGCDNYTTCPRTVTEVEHVMGGGKWPPVKDEAPELKRTRLTFV